MDLAVLLLPEELIEEWALLDVLLLEEFLGRLRWRRILRERDLSLA